MPGKAPIMIVDDDEGIVGFIQMALEGDGCGVVTARDGKAALALLETVMPCLILLDMGMPVMNGWEFAEAYKGTVAERAPVVVLTAGRDCAAAGEIGADGYLPKPFNIDDLLSVVDRHARNGAS